jgi:F-type H+-transporting ATPase subunit b
MEAAPTFYEQLAQWSEIIGGFAFFVVAILLFGKYVMPAVRAGQVASNADLTSAEARIEALKADVVKARAELEAADRDAVSIKARAVDDAARESQRIVDEAKADGERLIANARNELARARLAAQKQLRAEFVGRALELARARASSRIDGETNSRLVGATVGRLTTDRAGDAA